MATRNPIHFIVLIQWTPDKKKKKAGVGGGQNQQSNNHVIYKTAKHK